MRASTIEERFWDWVDDPNIEGFLLLRQSVLTSDGADRRQHVPADARFWSHLQTLFDNEEFDAVLELAHGYVNTACLSPRFHLCCGIAAAACGDKPTSEMHRAAMQTLLAMILETGEGTQQSPFVVTYVGDEYDVLRALGTTPLGQSVVEDQNARCDVISCADGEDFWFDVSDLLVDGPYGQRARASAQLVRDPTAG